MGISLTPWLYCIYSFSATAAEMLCNRCNNEVDDDAFLRCSTCRDKIRAWQKKLYYLHHERQRKIRGHKRIDGILYLQCNYCEDYYIEQDFYEKPNGSFGRSVWCKYCSVKHAQSKMMRTKNEYAVGRKTNHPFRQKQLKEINMQNSLLSVMVIIRAIVQLARIKIHRGIADFLADRIIQAGTEPTLLAATEKLARLMDSDIGELHTNAGLDFLKVQNSVDAPAILEWLRSYPRIAAMIACLPKIEQVREACEQIIVEDPKQSGGVALPQGDFEIGIKLTTLSPLAHGSDMKAGNATLFRRMQVLSDKKTILNLPFYSGNAIRGEMRDLLADHFLKSLGIKPRRDNPPVALWFFHAIYAGGALEEDSKAAQAIAKAVGANGAVKAEGIYQFRDTLPALSLLGTALGNRILCGRAKFSDLRPECKEWGNGEIPAAQLFEWTYLTRREDFEGHEDGDNASMIANTECLRAGIVLHGGIDIDTHISDLERSALGRGLELLQQKKHIGAEGRRGFGKIQAEFTNAPNPKPYDDFLAEKKETILQYLTELGALEIAHS